LFRLRDDKAADLFPADRVPGLLFQARIELRTILAPRYTY
jgi:hypothetical protein